MDREVGVVGLVSLAVTGNVGRLVVGVGVTVLLVVDTGHGDDEDLCFHR